jgi:peptidyl-prolyl cis-trans isomerase SurA
MVSVLRLLGIFLLAWGVFASDVRVVEQIVAKVNNEIITTSELDRGRHLIEAELRRGGANDQQVSEALAERTKDVLRDRIDQLLLVQKGKDLNINVDSELTKELANIQLQNKIADQDQFQQWIRDQSGIPFEDFKSEMRNNFLTRRVISQEVGSRISIPRAESQEYYDKHKDEFVREERVFLSEILLSTQGKSGGDLATLEKKAKDLVNRARNGERFGELARDNSDADSARNSGQLGAFKRADLNKDIVQTVFNNDRGYVTDPIKVPNGFLILRVDERHQAGLAAFEEVENEISEKIYMPRFQPAIRTYLTKLREEAFLEIREGYVDTGAASGKDTAWRDAAQLKPQTVTREEIATRIRRRRLLWMLPLPGTKVAVRDSSSVQQ